MIIHQISRIDGSIRNKLTLDQFRKYLSKLYIDKMSQAEVDEILLSVFSGNEHTTTGYVYKRFITYGPIQA
jgi:hypothetical protein